MKPGVRCGFIACELHVSRLAASSHRAQEEIDKLTPQGDLVTANCRDDNLLLRAWRVR